MKKIIIAFTGIVLFSSCPPKDSNSPNDQPNDKNVFTGWTGNDDVAKVPTSLNIGFGGASTQPNSDLSNYLPPISNQGEYGTCVAWATAYYTKTASEAILHDYNSSQLYSPSFQSSPKYLFLSIPNSQKSQNCNGTDFVPALDALQQNGVATMATVPYENLQDCNSNLVQSSWNNDAANHKIKYYRKIDYTVESIKQQLSNKYPVIIGARLPDNFLNWQGGNVLSNSSGYTNGNTYHALTIVGYDDNRQAFRVANSWGTGWGDNGFIWIDYNYLLSQFVFNQNLYIIASDGNNVVPPDNPVNSGIDIATWVFSDISTYYQTGYVNARSLTFNLYNIGNTTASSSSNWSFYYMYYNAYNANDYGVIFQDNFNTTVLPNTVACPVDYNCNLNFSIPPGSNIGQIAFNSPTVTRSYFVPPLNGYYYLVMVADATKVFNEQNEQNNIFYTTSQLPKLFQNGYSTLSSSNAFKFENEDKPNKSSLKKSAYNTAVNDKNRNAYTPEEILAFVKLKINRGEIKQKLDSLANKPRPRLPYIYKH